MKTASPESIIPLTQIKDGHRVVIRSVIGGAGMRNKLAAMGIVAGHTAYKIGGDGGGPVIIKSVGTNIAIGRGMADKILVSRHK